MPYIKNKIFILIFFSIFSFIFILNSKSSEIPKNIIIMISDGCGYNQIDSASLYQYGKTGMQVYEQFPVKLAMATFSAGDFDDDGKWIYRGSYDPKKAWNWFNYVKSGYTDSASAGTAMSTGVKTYDKGIGVDPEKKPLKHLMSVAEEVGKATGVVTTVELSHATPATFTARNVSRNNYSEIAREMILDSKADVIMGCGHPLYDNNARVADKKEFKYVGGESVWKGLLAGNIDFDLDGDGKIDNSVEDADGDSTPDSWTLVQDVMMFRSLISGPTPKRVIGIPKVFETLQERRKVPENANYKVSEEKFPYQTPLNKNLPTLAEMVKGAINVLDNDPDGFILMIEGGAVDWACHDNLFARLIEEEIDFNRAVEAVVDWINQNSNWEETLLIVTADHECGYLTGPNSGPDPDDENDNIKPIWNPLINNGMGELPGMEWHSKYHTNSLVPFFANGAGADIFTKRIIGNDPVRGNYFDNTEIAKVIFELLSGNENANVKVNMQGKESHKIVKNQEIYNSDDKIIQEY